MTQTEEQKSYLVIYGWEPKITHTSKYKDSLILSNIFLNETQKQKSLKKETTLAVQKGKKIWNVTRQLESQSRYNKDSHDIIKTVAWRILKENNAIKNVYVRMVDRNTNQNWLNKSKTHACLVLIGQHPLVKSWNE